MVTRRLYVLWTPTSTDGCNRLPVHAFTKEELAWNFAEKQEVPNPSVTVLDVVLEPGAGYFNYEMSGDELLVSMKKGMGKTTVMIDLFVSEHAAGLYEWHVTARLGEIDRVYKSFSSGRCDTNKITLSEGISYGEMDYCPAPPQGSAHVLAPTAEAAKEAAKDLLLRW